MLGISWYLYHQYTALCTVHSAVHSVQCKACSAQCNARCNALQWLNLKHRKHISAENNITAFCNVFQGWSYGAVQKRANIVISIIALLPIWRISITSILQLASRYCNIFYCRKVKMCEFGFVPLPSHMFGWISEKETVTCVSAKHQQWKKLISEHRLAQR